MDDDIDIVVIIFEYDDLDWSLVIVAVSVRVLEGLVIGELGPLDSNMVEDITSFVVPPLIVGSDLKSSVFTI